MRVQLLPGVRPVGLVVARVAVHGEDRGVGGQPSGAGEPDEGRQEEAPGHVTAGAEDDESLEHVCHAAVFPE